MITGNHSPDEIITPFFKFPRTTFVSSKYTMNQHDPKTVPVNRMPGSKSSNNLINSRCSEQAQNQERSGRGLRKFWTGKASFREQKQKLPQFGSKNMKPLIQTHLAYIVTGLTEVEKLIETHEIAVGLDPVATIEAMKNGAVFDCGPGGAAGRGRYRHKYFIRITAEVAGRRLKIGNENRITARVGTALPAHNSSGRSSRCKSAHDNYLAAAKALCERLNALAEHVCGDGRYIRLPSGGFCLVVHRQGSSAVVRIKSRLHVLSVGNLEPLICFAQLIEFICGEDGPMLYDPISGCHRGSLST